MKGDNSPYPALSGLGADRLAAASTRIFVTGAGGWLGLATLELLHGLLGERFENQVVCFGSNARALALRGGLIVHQRPLARLKDLAPAPTLLLHLAFLTQEKAKVMPEADYVAVNQALSAQVMNALDAIGAEGVFLPSSGAVYLVDDPAAQSSMRLYGHLKLADEARFADWRARTGARLAIARVFNLSGPYINKTSSYALACFIADALADRPIAIRARHLVFRSYVAISELMSVAFGVLTDRAENPIAFDTAGDDVYEMAQVARVVADVLGHDRGVSRPALEGGDIDRYVGDGAAYTQLRRLNRVTPVSFANQVRETARYMSDLSGLRRPMEWNSTR